MLINDERFSNTNILDKRVKEWDFDIIDTNIREIFSNIDKLPNFKFKKLSWNMRMESTRRSVKKEEMKKNIYRTAVVTIDEYTKKGELKKEHVYNIQIPELLYGQFFNIGGLLKIPIFQVHDDPLIYRNTKKGRFLKFKNNGMSLFMLYNMKKQLFFVNIYNKNLKLNKAIPLPLLLACYFKTEENIEKLVTSIGIEYKISIDENETNTLPSDLTDEEKIFIKTIKDSLLLLKNNDLEDLIDVLGSYRTSSVNTDQIKKGNSIIDSITISYDVDIFTKKYMTSDCILTEMFKHFIIGLKSDTHLDHKRLRFSEYIFAPLISNVYDMICTLNYSSKVRFKISPSIIMDTCNVSDVIHYNFVFNPVGEIASMFQTSLTGPGGFKKQNVPMHLRDLDESHFKKICPADTPDRDGCGVITNLVPGCSINELGKFESKSDLLYSYPINYVPFVKNNDPTRLQMSSSQTKQSLFLENAQPAYIRTGAENMLLEYTTFKQLAKDSGKVIKKTNKFIVIAYDNLKTTDILTIGYREMYLNSVDILETKLEENDTFSKDDVLVQSKFIKEEGVSLGQNLLTAIVSWDGMNFEDGVVISETAAKKFTSLHMIDLSFEIKSGQILLSLDDNKYKPLPKIGDKLSRGEVYAKIKHIIGEDGVESINLDATELYAKEECEIVDIEIIANSWNKQIPQFDNFIRTNINNQHELVDGLKTELLNYDTEDNINKMFIINNLTKYEDKPLIYVEKDKEIKSIIIKIKAVFKEEMGVGDKLANRHGGKNVVSHVLPDELRPLTEDGRPVDIIINQLGIVSRMNVGQLYELNLNEALYQFKKELLILLETNKIITPFIIKLKEFLDITDKTKNNWGGNYVIEKFKEDWKINKEYAINNISSIQPSFQSLEIEDLFKAMKYTGAKFKSKLTRKENGFKINKKVSTGYMYFSKLVHRASDKMMGRSIGSYNQNTLQPVGGKKRQGGHRLGEMEIWALLSSDAKELVKEFLTTYSDSPGKKNKLLASMLNNPELSVFEEQDETPQSFRLFEAYLKSLGLEITD